MIPDQLYVYRAKIIHIHDADTVWCEVDYGFDNHGRYSFRLAEINAPELSTPEGKLARNWLVDRINNPEKNPTPWRGYVRTIKDRREKYGRYLAWIYTSLDQVTDEEMSINAELVSAGHAVWRTY